MLSIRRAGESVSSPLCDLAPVAPDIVLGLFSREGEAYRAAVLLAGPQRLCREIRVVGSVGKSLHLHGDAVVVLIRASRAVLRASGEPVARVYMLSLIHI